MDKVEFGTFVSRVKFAPLARPLGVERTPALVGPDWPLKLKEPGNGADLVDAIFMVSYLHNEEKGSDVNVGTHLLLDVLEQKVDAAIVISNDSDLKLPIGKARSRIPIGLVNPGKAPLAGDLRGAPQDGVGGHWWRRLSSEEIRDCQLPTTMGEIRKPENW